MKNLFHFSHISFKVILYKYKHRRFVEDDFRKRKRKI